MYAFCSPELKGQIFKRANMSCSPCFGAKTAAQFLATRLKDHREQRNNGYIHNTN